jgi:hypothetical protein
MTQAVEKTSSTVKRRKRLSVNWVGAVTASAALMSGLAGMITAANGIWHPPVPIPVLQAKISWVGPSGPSPAASAAQPATLPTPSPSATPSIYQADWTNGMGGWVGGEEWKTVAGMLISDGRSFAGAASQGMNAARPPYRPARPDYAVTARIKIVSDPLVYNCHAALQLRVAPDGQGQETHGYYLGYVQGTGAVITSFHPSGLTTPVSHATFSPGNEWHEYSAVAKDNLLSLKIDGSTVLEAPDNKYLDAGQVGIMSDACQLQVGSFTVTPI